MLPDEQNDLLYLLNILEYIGKIQNYTENLDNAEALFEYNEQMNLNASLTLLANIGENTAKLSDALKNGYTDIEWQKIHGFRNRIVHDYMGIDLAIVYGIIADDLPKIKTEIEDIVKVKTIQGTFDPNEIELCKGSRYYKHVDFSNLS
jgi:uncharacterized protein with HEPN domain